MFFEVGCFCLRLRPCFFEVANRFFEVAPVFFLRLVPVFLRLLTVLFRLVVFWARRPVGAYGPWGPPGSWGPPAREGFQARRSLPPVEASTHTRPPKPRVLRNYRPVGASRPDGTSTAGDLHAEQFLFFKRRPILHAFSAPRALLDKPIWSIARSNRALSQKNTQKPNELTNFQNFNFCDRKIKFRSEFFRGATSPPCTRFSL